MRGECRQLPGSNDVIVGGNGADIRPPQPPPPDCLLGIEVSARRTLGTLDAQSWLGLGGWTLSPVHALDTVDSTVFRGDGDHLARRGAGPARDARRRLGLLQRRRGQLPRGGGQARQRGQLRLPDRHRRQRRRLDLRPAQPVLLRQRRRPAPDLAGRHQDDDDGAALALLRPTARGRRGVPGRLGRPQPPELPRRQHLPRGRRTERRGLRHRRRLQRRPASRPRR